MNRREAIEELEYMIAERTRFPVAPGSHRELALRLAKQALDILAIIDDGLHLREPVTIEKLGMLDGVWTATRGTRTHVGVDVTDALGQLCQVLAMEKD